MDPLQGMKVGDTIQVTRLTSGYLVKSTRPLPALEKEGNYARVNRVLKDYDEEPAEGEQGDGMQKPRQELTASSAGLQTATSVRKRRGGKK